MKNIIYNILFSLIIQIAYGLNVTIEYPSFFSWDNYEGRSLITSMQSQKSPHSCGSCWAMSTAQSLSDRIKIKKYLKRKEEKENNSQYLISDSETILSSQVLLSCDNYDAYGCYGGQIRNVYKWVQENSITDETCSPYLAKGEKEEKICNQLTFCSSCNLTTQACGLMVNDYKNYTISDHGFISGEQNMMEEIYKNGPINCYMRTDSYYDFQYHSGIYIDTSGSNQTDHAVSIIGWGEQYNSTLNTTLKYWIIRNTYGSFWGDGGFMKILKGSNNAGIEQECVWATPNLQQIKEEKVLNTKVFVDWRNYNGSNFISPLRNLLTPSLCSNISWAEAALSSLEDRINIQNWKNQVEEKIPIRLALQSVINCINNGKCNGDQLFTPIDVYKMAIKQGIPDESCNTFEGEVDLGMNQERCSGLAQCKYCYLPHYPFIHMDDNCTSLPTEFTYKKYFAYSYGMLKFNETNKIKIELQMNGPITCQIAVDDELLSYQRGVYTTKKQNQSKQPNHWITIIGWGYDEMEQSEFWIAKNSWGSHWGENGFFRISVNSLLENNSNMMCAYPIINTQISQY